MLEIIKQFVNDFSVTEYVGAIIGLLVTIATFYNFISNRLKEEKNEIIEKHIITTESINSYINDINNQLYYQPSIYKSLLHNILDFLTKNLGELKVFSFNSFSKHYVISFIYSFFFFYFVWLLGGNGQIGSLKFIDNIYDRSFITFFIIIETLIVYILIKKIKIYTFLNEKGKSLFLNFLLIINIILFSLIYGVHFGIIIFISFAILGTITLITTSLKETVPLLNKVLMIGFGIIVVLGLLLVTWLISIMLIGVILKEDLAVNLQIIGITETNIVIFLFALILPFINAIFDYISMYFSRFFAYKILKTHSKLKIILDALLDLIVAIILLYLLAVTLFYVVDLINIYFIKEKALFIPIETYKAQLLANPFNKDILWVTLMFISTLVPTILHLFLATYSILAYWFTKPHLHDLVAQLSNLKPNDPNYLKKENTAKGLVSYRLASIIKIYLFIGSLLLIVLSIVVFMLLLKKGLYVL